MMFFNLHITQIPLVRKNMFLMSLSDSWQYGDCWLFHVVSANSMDNKNIIHKIVQKCWDDLRCIFYVCPISVFICYCAVLFSFMKFSISQWEIMKYANFYFHSQLFIICSGLATVLSSFKREKQISWWSTTTLVVMEFIVSVTKYCNSLETANIVWNAELLLLKPVKTNKHN